MGLQLKLVFICLQCETLWAFNIKQWNNNLPLEEAQCWVMETSYKEANRILFSFVHNRMFNFECFGKLNLSFKYESRIFLEHWTLWKVYIRLNANLHLCTKRGVFLKASVQSWYPSMVRKSLVSQSPPNPNIIWKVRGVKVLMGKVGLFAEKLLWEWGLSDASLTKGESFGW